jgi:hypothetical protein
MANILEKHKVAYALRKTAERYLGSKRPYDVEQGRTLEAIANSIVGGEIEDAILRFDSLHSNIKSHLPFHVLDYLDQAEKHMDL